MVYSSSRLRWQPQLSVFLLIIGEFLASFGLSVLIAIGLVLGLVLGVGGGFACGSLASIELNFCSIPMGNLLLIESFLGMGFLGGSQLAVVVTNGWVGGGGCGCSTVDGCVGWLILGVIIGEIMGCGRGGATIGGKVFSLLSLLLGVTEIGLMVVLCGWLDSNIVANIFNVELGSLFSSLVLFGRLSGLNGLNCLAELALVSPPTTSGSIGGIVGLSGTLSSFFR